MKKLWFIFATVIFALTACSTSKKAIALKAVQPKVEAEGEYSPHTLIIYYDTTVGKDSLLKAAKKMGCDVFYQYENFNAVALSVPDKIDINKAKAEFEKVKGVLQVSRDRIYHLD
jgi:hypothetical protein